MITNDMANDQARQWSSQLGELAAGASLAHFRQRQQMRQHVAEKLRTLEFLHGT
jgi:hypothetical protein